MWGMSCENRQQIPPERAQQGCMLRLTAPHNPKVVGSNPAPATKESQELPCGVPEIFRYRVEFGPRQGRWRSGPAFAGSPPLPHHRKSPQSFSAPGWFFPFLSVQAWDCFKHPGGQKALWTGRAALPSRPSSGGDGDLDDPVHPVFKNPVRLFHL